MEALNVEFFGKDQKILKAVQFAGNLAVTKAPVLVVGEVGTGKRTLARFIHEKSSRHSGPFIVVDCAQASVEVENSILGHRDEDTGRFHKGALERGNGGTIVLANVDSLEDEFQKKLHKIINELADYEIDLRIVSTTTKNLSKLVGAGRFYRGLYTYLSGTQISLIPLRERTEDIRFVSAKLLEHFSTEAMELSFSDGAIEKLMSHYWTHNVAELSSVIENAVLNNEDEIIDENDLEIGERKTVSLITDGEDDGIKLMSLKEAEKLLIKKALIHTSENRTQAAKILGVSIRTLRNKINEYRTDGNQFFLGLR